MRYYAINSTACVECPGGICTTCDPGYYVVYATDTCAICGPDSYSLYVFKAI